MVISFNKIYLCGQGVFNNNRVIDLFQVPG